MEMNMASKKKAGRGGRPTKGSGPTKSDFIRQHPSRSVAEVVAKAREAGMSVSSVLVYKVRGRTNPKPAKGTPGPKPNGKRGPKPKNGMTASDFVRSMPVTMKAKEVLAAAKAKGIKLSRNLVYMVRSTEKKKAGGSSSANGKPGRKPRAAAVPTRDLSTFKKLALDLGISTARRALDELERGLAALLG
jgi:hypothetical protein